MRPRQNEAPPPRPSAGKVHLRRARPGPFGGTLTTSLCSRLRVTGDGMNVSDERGRVTCALCLRIMRLRRGMAHT